MRPDDSFCKQNCFRSLATSDNESAFLAQKGLLISKTPMPQQTTAYQVIWSSTNIGSFTINKKIHMVLLQNSCAA